MNDVKRELLTCCYVVNNRSIVGEKILKMLSQRKKRRRRKKNANEKQINMQEINQKKNP
jgi:hypothetical protein